ncbi:MAG TPA: hypothetical protein VMK12_14775 [Anaeromyxobacteraceae bacterium]|nr:hypothetical protein [Anaeromyxobacteraceae bacterium]
MRALTIFGWVMFGLAAAAALGLVLGFPVMWLWNWLMPQLFRLPALTFWQAVGLLLLCHLLFKGHSPGFRHGEHRDHKPWDRFARRVRTAMEKEPSPSA